MHIWRGLQWGQWCIVCSVWISLKIMYNNEKTLCPIITAYKWNHKGKMWCIVKALGHIVFLLTHSCFEWESGSQSMMRSLLRWHNSLHSVNEMHVEIKIINRSLTLLKVSITINGSSNTRNLAASASHNLQAKFTHRQGDTEVIGDVLERQHGHWPQVMSPLRQKYKKYE